MIFHLSLYVQLEQSLRLSAPSTVSPRQMATSQMTLPQLTICPPPSVSLQTVPNLQECSSISLVEVEGPFPWGSHTPLPLMCPSQHSQSLERPNRWTQCQSGGCRPECRQPTALPPPLYQEHFSACALLLVSALPLPAEALIPLDRSNERLSALRA